MRLDSDVQDTFQLLTCVCVCVCVCVCERERERERERELRKIRFFERKIVGSKSSWVGRKLEQKMEDFWRLWSKCRLALSPDSPYSFHFLVPYVSISIVIWFLPNFGNFLRLSWSPSSANQFQICLINWLFN